MSTPIYKWLEELFLKHPESLGAYIPADDYIKFAVTNLDYKLFEPNIDVKSIEVGFVGSIHQPNRSPYNNSGFIPPKSLFIDVNLESGNIKLIF